MMSLNASFLSASDMLDVLIGLNIRMRSSGIFCAIIASVRI